MDTEKLLIQDNPPTRKEWNALNQGVRNWTMYALVDRDAVVVQCIQRRPYTALQLAFDAGEAGEETHLGDGFSKVCHPDTYCPDEGARIARMRCVRMIVKQLLNDQPTEGYDLRVAGAYDVLVAKWDHYLEAVEDVLSVARAFEAKEAEEAVPFEEVVAKLEAELGPYADATIKHPVLDAEVGVDPAAEGDDESVGTKLVYTRAGQVR